MSRKYGARLSVIHIVHNPFVLEGWDPQLEDKVRTLIDKSKADIDAAINAEREQGMTIQEIVREGEPPEVW